jgi:hypothetical protein
MRFLLSALLVLGCASPVLLEVEDTPSPLANAVAEVESLEQPVRTVGPDLPTQGVPEELYHRVTRIADLPLEGGTESHNCPPPIIEEPIDPVVPTVTVVAEPPTTGAKALMLVIVLGVPLLAASIYLALGTYRARKIAKEFRGKDDKKA